MAFAATLSMTVPTVPLLGALVVLNPRRWLAISIWTMLGSALGGALLVHLFGHFGALFLAAKLPELMASPHWQHMAAMTSHHGWWMLALIAASPVSQTPFLLVAAILGMPAFAVFFSLVAGKAVKYGLVAVVTSRTAEDLASAYGSRTPPDG